MRWCAADAPHQMGPVWLWIGISTAAQLSDLSKSGRNTERVVSAGALCKSVTRNAPVSCNHNAPGHHQHGSSFCRLTKDADSIRWQLFVFLPSDSAFNPLGNGDFRFFELLWPPPARTAMRSHKERPAAGSLSIVSACRCRVSY